MVRGKKLIKGSTLNVFLLILNVAVSFYMMPFLIGSLGDKTYGLWVLVASFIGYYGFLDFGISIAVSRFISTAIGKNDESEKNNILGTALYLFCFIGVFAFFVTILLTYFAPHIIKNTDDIALLRLLLFIVGLNTSISFPVRVFSSLLNANLRFDSINYINISVFILKTILMIFLIKLGFGILALALIMFGTSLLEYSLIIVSSCRNGFHFNEIKYSKPHIKKIFSFSSFAFISQLADILKFHVDALVITIFIGLSFVTPYQVAFRLFQYGGDFLASVMNVVSPIFAQEVGKNDYVALREKFLITTKISTVLACFVCGGLILFSNAFFLRWLKTPYDDIYLVAVILSISGLFAMGQRPSVNILYATANHHYYSFLNVTEGVANLILSIILVKKYGIIGVALGTAISSLIIKTFCQPYFTCKSINLSLIKYYYSFLINLLKLSILSFCFYYVVKYFIEPSYIKLIILSIVWTLIIASSIFIVFTFDERKYLFSYFKRNKNLTK